MYRNLTKILCCNFVVGQQQMKITNFQLRLSQSVRHTLSDRANLSVSVRWYYKAKLLLATHVQQIQGS